MLTGLSGLSGLSGLVGVGGVAAPPLSSFYSAYYDASKNTTLSGVAAANYGKVDSWLPVMGSGSLVQGTDANRMRLRKLAGFKEVIYQDQSESSRTMADSTVVIDKRACTIFVLVELGSLIVNSIAESHTLVSIPTAGTTGELYLYKAGSSRFYVAWKDGTGTYVSALEPASSLNLIGVTLSTGAVQVHCNGASETLAAAALSAGSVTGFRLNYGTLLYNEQGAYHAVVLYNKALDAGEVSQVTDWGRQRGAVYPADSDVVQHLYMAGASRAVGYHPSGNLSHGRQIAARDPKRLFRIGAFGGLGIGAMLTRVRVEYGLLGEGSGYPVGTRWNNPNKRQVVLMEIPTADTTSSVASATQIATLSTIRQEFRASGYNLLVNALAPVQSWSGAQQTIANDVNAAMAALDQRRYGKFHALPTELSDPSNLTYFSADGVHYTKAGYDVLFNDNVTHIESMLALSVTSLRGYWPLNGDLMDNSGWERDMSLLNSPTFETGLNGSQCLRCYTTGNHAAKFYAPTRSWDTLPLSVVFWFKVPSLGSSERLICKEADALGSKNWVIYKKWNNNIVIGVTDATTSELESGFTVTADTWYGVAMVLDATNGIKLYTTNAGGDPATFALRNTATWSAGAVIPNAGTGRGNLRFGNNIDSGASNCFIQGVRIYFAELNLSGLQAMTPEGSDVNASPTAPLSLQNSGVGLNPTLNWSVPASDGNSALTGYKVYKNNLLIASLPANQLMLIPGAGQLNDVYYVTATNLYGESPSSNTVQLLSSDPVTLWQDTFSSDDNLSTHLPDVGVGYSVFNDGDITGGVLVCNPSGITNFEFLSLQVAESFYIEAVFAFSGATGYVRLYFNFVDSADTWYIEVTSSTVKLYEYTPSSGSAVQRGSTWNNSGALSSFIVKAAVSAGGDDVIVFVEYTPVISYSTANRPGKSNLNFAFEADAVGGITVDDLVVVGNIG